MRARLRSLILRPDLPFLLVISSHNFHSAALYCIFFPKSSADVVCVLHSLHLYFPLPQARFCCGYLVPCWSRPKIFSAVWCFFLIFLFFLQVCNISISFGSALRLAFDISALLCYHTHSNVCKYMVSLNTNVSLLLFCMCLLFQVLVFDPVRVGRV